MKGNIYWQYAKIDSIKSILNSNCNSILIYSGEMPTTAIGFTKAVYSGFLLATYTTSTSSYVINSSNYAKMYLGTIPNAVNASGSGLATWFCCTAAANDLYVFLGEVSDVNGTGILMFWDNNFVAGQSKQIYSMAMNIKQL